jgi:Nuclease-related domain/UvrD-like helicase C-terminal domain/AAA domain
MAKAKLIPFLNSCAPRMTPGERRLARQLKDKLDEDYLIWYDVPIGPKRLHPDFVILHPHRGIIVLEVKDWKLSTIRHANHQSMTLLVEGREKSVDHPLEQARHYALEIAQLLERDPLLVQGDGRYKGKLAFPYGYGAVLTNITRKQFEAEEGLRETFESNLVVCQDEFYERVDEVEFQERLWNLFSYQFGEPLTPAQIDRVRWHLYRGDIEISVGGNCPKPQDAEPDRVERVQIPDIIRILDIQQEQLARSIGDGHRVIHGVAGSGKTLILVYRCLRLVEETTKPILVLCFNVSLAAKLRQMLHEKGIADRVVVRHFHGWCSDLMGQYRIPQPSPNQFQGQAYADEIVARVIRAVDAEIVPAGRYGAVLIDEGHDFQAEWLQLLVKMVDPETHSLLLLYDDAQNIYEKKERQKFTFKSVGIQAQGRTTILTINYRNTVEVLAVAYEFAKEAMAPAGDLENDEPVIVLPQSAGRHGSIPELIQLPSFRQEIGYILDRLEEFHDRGTPWNEMAIVYRSQWMAKEIVKIAEQRVPIEWLNRDSYSRNYRPAEDSVKLLTMHACKGLEFSIVCLPGLGYMPTQNVAPHEEARLLYVAMTRAIDRLVMTCDRSSDFARRMGAAVAKVA